MHSLKTEGIILKRSNFGEADRILTIFTKQLGKIKVLAKGVRKITSRRGSNVEVFNFSQVSLYQSKKFLILTEAQTINSYPEIRKSLKIIGLAYHLSEIVDALTGESQEHPEVFDSLVEIFSKLNNVKNLSGSEKQTLIKDFEIDLLHSLGFVSKAEVGNNFNPRDYIEELIEKELKSKKFIKKLQDH